MDDLGRDPTDVLDIRLTADERQALIEGLDSYHGPATMSNRMARAIGFESYRTMFDEAQRIIGLLERKAPMTRWDWSRALLALEISFGSDWMGAGVEWDLIGLSDEKTLPVLRALQFKLVGIRVSRDLMDDPS